MKISLRGWVVVGTFALIVAGLVILWTPFLRAADGQPSRAGMLDHETLGTVLRRLGLKPKLEEKRYDFAFKSEYGGEEWELTMSAIMSQNGESVWVMAWLDALPRSAANVPRTALLRLLSDNDRLGRGKFFAYIAANRRFVLQQVVPNENLSTAKIRHLLHDLGSSVVETYPHWAVTNWSGKNPTSKNVSGNASRSRGAGAAPAPQSRSGRTAVNPRNSVPQ